MREKLYVCERLRKCIVCMRSLGGCLGVHLCVSVYVCTRKLSVCEIVCMCISVYVLPAHVCSSSLTSLGLSQTAFSGTDPETRLFSWLLT